jgi:ketosteroid isomerase-like protein
MWLTLAQRAAVGRYEEADMDAGGEASEAAIRRCVELFNQCTVEWVDICYSPDADWTELPTRATPNGRAGKRTELRAAAERLLTLFPDRRLAIRSLVAQGQHVAAELDWSGTASVNTASAGAAVRLRIASFFTVVDGLITTHTDYCVPAGPQ